MKRENREIGAETALKSPENKGTLSILATRRAKLARRLF